MSELKHWLDESSEADDFERAILRSGALADPTDAKRDEVWSNVLGALAIVPAAVVAPATVAASAAKVATSGLSKAAAVWLGVGKGFIVGLAVYGAAAGISEIAQHFTAHPAPSASPARVAVARLAPTNTVAATPLPAVPAAPAAPVEFAPTVPSPEPPSALSASASASAFKTAPELAAPATDLPSIAAFQPAEAAPSSSAARASQLKAEAAVLSSVREALRAGRLTDAFAQLEASRRQFAAPELYQEREALTIELLSRSGQPAVAQQRADAFLRRFPESPHADHIRRFATH